MSCAKGCAPEAVITTATVAAETDVNGRLDWYARLPIAIPARPCTTDPNAVIGFHEYQGGYYFAVVDLTGKLIDLGELSVPENVGPHTRKGRTSDNFAFEMAWAMLRQSQMDNYKAYIGVENTAWKREKVELSADKNRETFAFPRERIFEIARYKAAREGLLLPEKVRGVAPSRDCGNCGHRAQNDTAIRWRPVVHCFHCQALDQSHSLERIADAEGVKHLHCTQCRRIWNIEEPQLKCSRCRILQHAQYNASLVVARRALDQLASDHQSAMESDDNDVVL